MLLAALTSLMLGASPSDEALVRLLEQGAALSAQGDHAGAVLVFERAHQLEPQAFGPLFNLGVELEALGKLGSAWLRFIDARAVAERAGDPRAQKASRRLEALQPKLSWVSVEGPLPPGATVTIQGSRASGSPPQRPVDPGPVEITVAAPGFITWSETREAPAPGSRGLVEVPALEPVRVERPRVEPPPSDAPTASRPSIVPAEVPAARIVERAAPSPKPVGVVLLGVGSAVAVGALVGVLACAMTLTSLEQQRVGTPGALMPKVSLADAQALTWGYPLSWVALVAGVGTAVTGAVLGWAAP